MNTCKTRLFGGLNFGIKKTRPTETGTLRIPHTSYSLIGERANKRRSFKNAKLHVLEASNTIHLFVRLFMTQTHITVKNLLLTV